ncbi:hypothetical protein [Marmoricola sp. RAF53]|uniref:hypothetical protein n=1 Tax=Marmoricola sp. RAF53 TaxID=3233059 RepID=UPI003F9C8B14
MSGLSPGPDAGPATTDAPRTDEPDWWREHGRPGLRDLGVVAAWFVVAGVLGAVVWWLVTPLAEFTRTADNGVMDEQQLAKQVATDGWFVVIALVGGLISGIALLSWRRRDPLLMVVLVALGGGLATWVMLRTGLILGPPDPDKVLATAKAGDKIPVRLDPTATGIYVVWSVAALLGAIGVIWGTDSTTRREQAEKAEQAEQG